MEWGLGPKRCTVAAAGQPSFETHTLKSGTQVHYRVEGSKLKNSLGDNFVSQNDEFTKG